MSDIKCPDCDKKLGIQASPGSPYYCSACEEKRILRKRIKELEAEWDGSRQTIANMDLQRVTLNERIAELEDNLTAAHETTDKQDEHRLKLEQRIATAEKDAAIFEAKVDTLEQKLSMLRKIHLDEDLQ